jgi:hypothetical protein
LPFPQKGRRKPAASKEFSDALTTNHAGPVREARRLTGAFHGRARSRRRPKTISWDVDPRQSPCATVPDPVALIGLRPGPAGIWDATCCAFRREAARPPSRNLTRTLSGGEPVALTGRRGGTDEFLGRQGRCFPDSARSGSKSGRLTLITCLAPPRADTPEWKFAAAADAKESTALRETRELKQEFFRIPGCAY